MPHVFALSGTHSSGKTTALRDVQNVLQWLGVSASVTSEAARDCPYPLNTSSGYEAQSWILFKHVASELNARSRVDCGVLLVDRSIYDHLAYEAWLVENGRMTRQQGDLLREIALEMKDALSYDAVFLFDPLKLEVDDKRSSDPEYQKWIHSKINRVLHENLSPLNYLHLKEANRLDRCGRIVQHILSLINYYAGEKIAVFFDVDGTLEGYGGTVTAAEISSIPDCFTGFVSVRDDGSKTIQVAGASSIGTPGSIRITPLRTIPVPYTDKGDALRLIRHSLRWISPLQFYYVGDKQSDMEAAAANGWKFLYPPEFKLRFKTMFSSTATLRVNQTQLAGLTYYSGGETREAR